MRRSIYIVGISIVCAMSTFGQFPISAKQTVSSVTLLPAGTPEFSAAVGQLGEATSVAQSGAAGPYLIVIRNNGPKTIRSWRLLFEVSGGPHPTRSLSMSPDDSLLVGGVCISAPPPLMRLASSISSHRFLPFMSMGGLDSALKEGALLKGKTMVASIDSVTYNDGQFDGPDTLAMFQKLAQKSVDLMAFYSGLSGFVGAADGTMADWLASQIAVANAQRASEHGIDTFQAAANAVFTAAKTAQSTLKQGGGSSAVVQWAQREQAKLQKAPALYRK